MVFVEVPRRGCGLCQHVEERDEGCGGIVAEEDLSCLRPRGVVEHIVEVQEEERSRWCLRFHDVLVDCGRRCVGDKVNSALNLYAVLSASD